MKRPYNAFWRSLSMLYIIIAILIFGILVATHELGHFVAAKLSGVRVNEIGRAHV